MEFTKNPLSKNKLYTNIYEGLFNIGLKNSEELILLLTNNNLNKDLIIQKLKKNLLILETKNNMYINRKTKIKYKYNNYINKGRYHKIYKIYNIKTLRYYVMRKQRGIGNNLMFQSFIDFFIHMILSAYQDMQINKYNNCTKIHNIYLNTDKTKIIGIIDLYDGTLKDLLFDYKISPLKKIKIIFNCLYQIAYYLKDMQHVFQFMHNDLKINNILYKSTDSQINNDFYFFINDFGFSRLRFNKTILVGNNFNECISDKQSLQFIPGKDLYFLLHNIWFFTDDNFLKDEVFILGNNIFKDFDTSISKKEHGWRKIYNDFKYHPNYEPENVIKIIKENYYDFVLIK